MSIITLFGSRMYTYSFVDELCYLQKIKPNAFSINLLPKRLWAHFTALCLIKKALFFIICVALYHKSIDLYQLVILFFHTHIHQQKHSLPSHKQTLTN